MILASLLIGFFVLIALGLSFSLIVYLIKIILIGYYSFEKLE